MHHEFAIQHEQQSAVIVLMNELLYCMQCTCRLWKKQGFFVIYCSGRSCRGLQQGVAATSATPARPWGIPEFAWFYCTRQLHTRTFPERKIIHWHYVKKRMEFMCKPVGATLHTGIPRAKDCLFRRLKTLEL